MSPEAVSFEKLPTLGVENYTVRIKGMLQEEDKQAVKDIARRHRLSVREEKGEVLIFT